MLEAGRIVRATEDAALDEVDLEVNEWSTGHLLNVTDPRVHANHHESSLVAKRDSPK